jgi:hypothetical protein
MFDIRCRLLDVESSWPNQQFNRKPAALAGFTLHEHAPAVRLDDVFHDAQADSNTLRLAAQLGTAPVKPLKDFFVFLRRNARAVVADKKVER